MTKLTVTELASLYSRAKEIIRGELHGTIAQEAAIVIEPERETDYVSIWHVKISLPRADIPDMMEVFEKLSMFCMNDDSFTIDGREAEADDAASWFLLGDGDDGSAVWYENGNVVMWLRNWPKGM